MKLTAAFRLCRSRKTLIFPVFLGVTGIFWAAPAADVLAIAITAPKAYRINKVMEMYGDSREQAVKSIERSDAARRSYYESITHKKWGDSHGYELCVDSSAGVEETARIIFSYIKILHGGN